MLHASSRFDQPFTCVDSTGAVASPTGTPTGTLVKNGSDTGTTVTVTMSGAQGIAACTIPSDAAVGDRFYIRISAVISGTTYVVAGPSDVVEVAQTGDSFARIGSAGAGLTAIGDTRLANLDAAVSTRATPTNITAATGVVLAATTHTGAVIPTVTTLTGHTAQTGDCYARIGAGGAGLTSLGDTRLANLDAPISGLNNLSALCNLLGPPILEIPDSGTAVYMFTMVVRDGEGKLVDLDDTPTLVATNATGDSRNSALSSVTHASTGRYTFTYSVSSTATQEAVRVISTGATSGEARYGEWVGVVVDYAAYTMLAAIKAKTDQLTFSTANVVDASPTSAGNIRSALGMSTANLDSQLDTIKGYIDTDVAAIKAKTDNLPSDPADQSAIEAAITSAMTGVAQSTDLVVISDVTDKLDGMLEADGLLWKFTEAALENSPASGAGSTVVVQPLNASMPVKSVVPLLTFYRDEEGEVIGPIQISGRSGSTVVPVDLSGKTLEVVFLDYTGITLLTVVDADITVSGTDNDQITFPVTTDLTGTVTEDHPDQYHYWSLRDVTSGNNVLVSGRARVLLG